MTIMEEVISFQWDDGNRGKNHKHNVNDGECEEVFFDPGKRVFKDAVHSMGEKRWRIIGKKKLGRMLFVVFTKRRRSVRIISARDINRKEVYLYEEAA